MKKLLALVMIVIGGVIALAGLGAVQGAASLDPQPRWAWHWRQPPYEVDYSGGYPWVMPAVIHVAWGAPDSLTIYAVTSNAGTYDPIYPDGLYRSVDAGSSWEHLGRIQPEGVVESFVVHPITPTLLFAGCEKLHPPGGIHRSTDGGLSWTSVLSDEYIFDIEIDPGQPSRLYAVLGRGLIYRSDDTGLHWQEISDMPFQDVEVHPELSNILYGARYLSTNPEEGVYRSEDYGQTWEQILLWRETHVRVDPSTPTRLFAFGGTYSSVWRSEDGGLSWTNVGLGLPAPVTDPLRTIDSVAFDPQVPGRIWAGLKYGGMFMSEDAGDTWLEANDGIPFVGQGIYGPQCTSVSFVAADHFAIACQGRLYVGQWYDNWSFLPIIAGR